MSKYNFHSGIKYNQNVLFIVNTTAAVYHGRSHMGICSDNVPMEFYQDVIQPCCSLAINCQLSNFKELFNED